MANDLIYNPLIRKGFQELGKDYTSDISALQNAINSLQSQANALQTALNTLKGNKITKCFAAADLTDLQTDEIFEWQGESTTVSEVTFVNGYFYKKIASGSPIELQNPYYVDILNSINFNNISVIGPQYQYSEFSSFSDWYIFKPTQQVGKERYTVITKNPIVLNVGDLVFDSNSNSLTSIISKSGGCQLANGDSFYASGGAYSLDYLCTVIDSNRVTRTIALRYNSFSNVNVGVAFIVYDSDSDTISDFAYSENNDFGQNSGTVIIPPIFIYTQTNTQPDSSYTLPIAAANVLGGVKIGNGLNIDANGILSAAGNDNLKVPRCFTQTQINALSNGDIFQWQAATTTDYTQGYFYKKTKGHSFLPPGTTYLLYEEGSPTITQNNYVFAPDNYYIRSYVIDGRYESVVRNFFDCYLTKWNSSSRYYFILRSGVSLQVGDLVWDNEQLTFVIVTSIDSVTFETYLSNGDIITNSATTGDRFNDLLNCVTVNNKTYAIIRTYTGSSYLVVHYTLEDLTFSLIDWFYIYVVTRTTTTPVIIGDTYTRINTQPEGASPSVVNVSAINVNSKISMLLFEACYFNGFLYVTCNFTVTNSDFISNEVLFGLVCNSLECISVINFDFKGMDPTTGAVLDDFAICFKDTNTVCTYNYTFENNKMYALSYTVPMPVILG